MRSLGQKLLHIAQRDRWVLFSVVINSNGEAGKPIPIDRDAEEDLEKPFRHPFFQDARKRFYNHSPKERKPL